jgi:endonuclease G
MTNILPHAPDNNRGVWRELEEYARDLVYQQDRELYILAGGYGDQGILAQGRLTIPSRLWKVIVVLDQPGQGLLALAQTVPSLPLISPTAMTSATTGAPIKPPSIALS